MPPRAGAKCVESLRGSIETKAHMKTSWRSCALFFLLWQWAILMQAYDALAQSPPGGGIPQPPTNLRISTAPPLVPTVTTVGITEQLWQGSDEWRPATLSHTVSGAKTLITLGCWWDGSGGSRLPTDTIGAFTAAVNPTTPSGQSPVRVQVAYQAGAAAGLHTVTPDFLGSSGDGFFLLTEAEGLATDSPVRDSGHARDWVPIRCPTNPDTIQTITVATDGAAAQVGDLVVALFAMDPCSNPDIQGGLPSGWTSLGFNDVVVDNIGYQACYKVVTTAGTQTAAWTWIDDSTFVAEAAMVVFKRASATP